MNLAQCGMGEDKSALERDMQHYRIVEKVMDVPIRNQYGEFLVAALVTSAFGSQVEHLTVYKNLDNVSRETALPVRINSGCLTAEVLGCDRCDCKWQLDESLRYIALVGAGLLIYHPQHEGRGLGLSIKLKSYKLMDNGYSTAQAFRKLGVQLDARHFLSSVLILREFGIDRVNLLTNNPKKVEVLVALGIRVEKVTPLVMPVYNARLQRYLDSKRDEMGHMIPGGI